MRTAGTRAWEQEHLGEDIQYPSHPVVLAAMIMDRYPSLEAAAGRKSDGFIRAPGDTFLPGSGCAVYAALDLLRYALSDNQVLRNGIYPFAERYWTNWERQNERNRDGAARGRRQFERIRPYFEARLAVWGSADDPGSPFRVQPSASLAASGAQETGNIEQASS